MLEAYNSKLDAAHAVAAALHTSHYEGLMITLFAAGLDKVALKSKACAIKSKMKALGILASAHPLLVKRLDDAVFLR